MPRHFLKFRRSPITKINFRMGSLGIIKIYGLVQGVLYRVWACREAQKLSISGWVRNETDGTVYIETEGEEDGLDEFVALCHKGPPLARISKIKTASGEVAGFSGFEVR